MADRGAILNRGVFPECLWLIWHFSLNPSRCLLCSLQLYLSIHLSLAFHCSNSRLPLFKHLSTHPTPPSSSSSFFLLLLARHFVSPFPRFLFKHSSGEFQSTYASGRAQGEKISVSPSPLAPVFCVVAPPRAAAAVCFQLIEFWM